MTAARGLDLRGPMVPAPATAAVVEALRAAGVDGPGPDRQLAPDIDSATRVVRSGTARRAAESTLGQHLA
jgi:histidine ammonia-lyase